MRSRPLLLAVLMAVSLASHADFRDGMQAARRGDYVSAYNEWLPLANRGNSDAQNNLGVLLSLIHI